MESSILPDVYENMPTHHRPPGHPVWEIEYQRTAKRYITDSDNVTGTLYI